MDFKKTQKILSLAFVAFIISSCSSQESKYTNSQNDNYYGGYNERYSQQDPRFIQRQIYQRDIYEGQIEKRYAPPKELEKKSFGSRSYFKKNRYVAEHSSSPSVVKVAILLPLSGKYKSLGESLLNAAQMALFKAGDSNFSLLPIDSKGTPFGAAAALDKAIKEGVKLVLGPVFGKSAKAIAAKAAENNINVISFSNDKSLADSGIFSIGFVPEQQISRIVEFSMFQGIEDFTAILPNSSYGAAAAKELRETVAKNDLSSVLKTEFFRSSKKGSPLNIGRHVASAYRSAIKTRSPKDYDEKAEAYNDEPITYPRAMLIPAGGKNLEQITAALEKRNIDNSKVQLLGSMQWYNDEALNNPILNGAWFAGAPHERRVKFKNEYQEIYGDEPSKIASLAYDAIALAVTISRMTRGDDFSREKLTNPRGFLGLDGIFRLKENGLAERGLAVIAISDGQFKVISPAPTRFFDLKKDEEDSEDDRG